MVAVVVVVHGVASQCDGFVPKIPKLALFHSCICWRSAFLPFLCVHALVQPVEHFIVFMMSSYQCCSNCWCLTLNVVWFCCTIMFVNVLPWRHSKIMGPQIYWLFITTRRNILLSKIIIQKPTVHTTILLLLSETAGERHPSNYRFGLCVSFGIVFCVSPGFVLSLLTKALMSCFQPIARW